MRVARKLKCGMVGVNKPHKRGRVTLRCCKESGMGREGSKYGLQEYQSIKCVTIGNLQA